MKNMAPLNKQSEERQSHMQEYFEAKAELERIAEENARLRAENQKLTDDLAEREAAVQNLFSYIHSEGV